LLEGVQQGARLADRGLLDLRRRDFIGRVRKKLERLLGILFCDLSSKTRLGLLVGG
jgi:hypothetical protein